MKRPQLNLTESMEAAYRLLYQFATEIQLRIDRGESLREISRWSYRNREETKYRYPYLQILDIDSETNEVTQLQVSPVKRQKEFSELFELRAPECKALRRFSLTVIPEQVVFTERLGKAPESVISLFLSR